MVLALASAGWAAGSPSSLRCRSSATADAAWQQQCCTCGARALARLLWRLPPARPPVPL